MNLIFKKSSKRLVMLMLVSIITTMAVSAQKNLAIGALFDGRYRQNPSVTETTIKGGSLEPYNLKMYRSISITGNTPSPKEIEDLLAKDGAKAIDSEVSYKGGKLYYAFYRMPRNDYNRYILYLNKRLTGGNKIVVMYIEGNASMNRIKSMFNHK